MGIIINMATDNVAFSIALGVLLLSVVLHPIVRACFYRIRADMAWRLIEKGEPVEVTKYGFLSEALGDRGRWDAARGVMLMMAAFHVSTWALELTIDLAFRTDGPVDLLNRPPPVMTGLNSNGSNSKDWNVYEYLLDVPDSGTLGSFHGTLENGHATTTYRIDNKIVEGNTLFASWSYDSESASGLFYDAPDEPAIVEGISCSIPLRDGDVYLYNNTLKWGNVSECESGPKGVNSEFEGSSSPPTIILTSTEGEVHMIVEEESSYPSFLYSVWTAEDATDNTTATTATTPAENISMELEHLFYISSTTRLVEAIVTSIVNGHLNGGSCVDLLRQFSQENTTYDLNGRLRISPFGEHPNSSSVETLDQVESIVSGIVVDDIGTVFGVILILVTASALLGCLCFPSRRPLDVYNRDELIRAVSLPGGEGADGKPPVLKISVKQEADKAFSIVISDDGVYRGCNGMRKKLPCLRDASAAPIASISRSISRSSSVPSHSREIMVDDVDDVRPAFKKEYSSSCIREANDKSARTCRDESTRPSRLPNPIRPVRTVELIASPVPSPAIVSARGGQHRGSPQAELGRVELEGISLATVRMYGELELTSSSDHARSDVSEIDVKPAYERLEARSARTDGNGTPSETPSVMEPLQPRAKQATPRVEVDVEATSSKK